MLCDKRLSVPITKAGSIAQAKGGCDKVLPAALSTNYLTASRSSANADPPHLRYQDRCVFHRNKSSDANPSDSACPAVPRQAAILGNGPLAAHKDACGPLWGLL